MKYLNGNIQAHCPDCGAPSTFILQRLGNGQNSIPQSLKTGTFPINYSFLLCNCCGRAALSEVQEVHGQPQIRAFYPCETKSLPLPAEVPTAIAKEFREAELCASVGAHRGAAALLRSVIEKTLIENGYKNSDHKLKKKIELAASEGIITAGLKRAALDDIKQLGDDILHDPWRLITPEEYDAAHHFTQRFLECFYAKRAETLAELIEIKRLPQPDQSDKDKTAANA